MATAVISNLKITICLQCPPDPRQNLKHLLNRHLKLCLSNKTANINGKNWPVYNQVYYTQATNSPPAEPT